MTVAKATQLILHFVNTDLSAFYFEIVKDRLYLDEQRGLSRRSAQTTMSVLLPFLSTAVTPICCHMGEVSPFVVG